MNLHRRRKNEFAEYVHNVQGVTQCRGASTAPSICSSHRNYKLNITIDPARLREQKLDDQNPNSMSTLPSSSTPRKVIYLPTTTAYDRWAQVYDSDSNPLQALDDLQLSTFLPNFLIMVSEASDGRPTTIVDLGCGTARNTIKLLPVPQSKIIGLDALSKHASDRPSTLCRTLGIPTGDSTGPKR